jgi:predicted lysophospholipase L1 biosynthesis ABC-type transport system permease subunit
VDHNLPVGEGLNTRELIQKQKTISKMPSVSQASVALTLFEILQMRIVRKIVMGDTTFEVQWNVEKLFQS